LLRYFVFIYTLRLKGSRTLKGSKVLRIWNP